MDNLKLLIADDEQNIRNGLKCILDWEQLGIKVCGEASNGKDAIQQITDLNPDIIIQDIKMPGATGIEVISAVKLHCQKNKIEMPSFIILSGFSEFDYAQKAINLGAKAYLLKPVDEDELLEKVKKISEEIRAARKSKTTSQNSSIFETKELLNRMIQSEIEPEEQEIAHLDFFKNAKTSNYQVLMCNIDYCKDIELKDFEKSIDNYFTFFTRVVLIQGRKIFIILKTTNEEGAKNAVLRTAKLQEDKTFITMGQNLKGLSGLINSYKNALELEKYLFFYSEPPYISATDIPQAYSDASKTDIDVIIDNLVFAVETYDKKAMENLKQQIKSKTFDISQSAEEIKKIFIYCLIELHYRLSKKFPEREISDGETYDVVQSLLTYSNFDDLYNCFTKILDNFLENFNFNTSDSVIVKVIAYVKNNYASDLKLETLGEMFNCNSAYLGKKFKKYTGKQFNAYLDDLRMEVAKDKLINTDLKIYQISKLVGFVNTDYFYMKFKKITGVTPKEFKKQIEDEKNS